MFKCKVQSCSAHSHHWAANLQGSFPLVKLTLWDSFNNNPPPSLLSSRWQPAFYFLSPWMWVLLVPHISGIRQYLPFCVWPISLSIMFSRFIRVVASVGMSFPYKVEILYLKKDHPFGQLLRPEKNLSGALAYQTYSGYSCCDGRMKNSLGLQATSVP